MDEIGRAVAQVQESFADASIILVDNSPEVSNIPIFNNNQVKVIRSGANIGYGSGHNLAFAESQESDYHAVLNTDLTYGSQVLPALLKFMDARPDVGLVMPRVCYPDGSIQHLCRLLPHPLDVFGRGFMAGTRWVERRNDAYEFRDWDYASEKEFPFLSGCFMVLRRSVVAEVGGFDERFFMYGEDVDLSRRINRRHRTIFFPHVTVYHEYRSQSGGFRRKISKIINLSRYFNKWGWIKDRERDQVNTWTIDHVFKK
ncbi:glycosyltransferase [Sphingomonas kyungheensis]|uniref:Glycosyltransferase n=1 Tax=Sphingomonas kyungheensis TaxID=1069987 RepID=A0ABU8H4I1_9SPHN